MLKMTIDTKSANSASSFARHADLMAAPTIQTSARTAMKPP